MLERIERRPPAANPPFGRTWLRAGPRLGPIAIRKVQPKDGYRRFGRGATICPMLWIVTLVILCPLVSVGAERLAARIPVEAGR